MGFSSKNTGVGCHSLLQGIFLTQESNLGLPHCRQILDHQSHQVLRLGTGQGKTRSALDLVEVGGNSQPTRKHCSYKRCFSAKMNHVVYGITKEVVTKLA